MDAVIELSVNDNGIRQWYKTMVQDSWDVGVKECFGLGTEILK